MCLPWRAGGLGALEDRAELRAADAGHHPGGAHRARADTDLDDVRACLDEVVHSLGCHHVAGHDRDLGVDGPDGSQRFQHPLLVTVGGVDDQAVHPHRQQLACLARDVTVDADRGGDPQASVAVQGGLVDGGAQRAGAGQDADEVAVVVHGGSEPVPGMGEYVERLAWLHRVLHRGHVGGHRVADLGEPVHAGAVGLGDDADGSALVEHHGGPVGPLRAAGPARH